MSEPRKNRKTGAAVGMALGLAVAMFSLAAAGKPSKPAPPQPAPNPNPPPIEPAAPVITATSSTTDTITVSWTESTPISEIYQFSLSVNGAAVYPSSLTATSVTFGGLLQGTAYSIFVVATSTTFDYAKSASVTVTTKTPPAPANDIPPTAPTDLTVSPDPGTGLPDLAWNASTSPYEASSDIQYLILEDGFTDPEDSPAAGQTSAQDIFIRVNSNYPYGTGETAVYVVAIDQFGNVSPPSNTVLVESAN